MNRIAIATVTAAALTAGLVTPAANAASLEVHKTHCIVHPSAKDVKNGFADNDYIIGRKGIDHWVNQYTKDAQGFLDQIAYLKDLRRQNAITEEYYKDQVTNEEELYRIFVRHAILTRACKNSEPLTDTDVDARALFSSPDEKSLNGAGIGVTVAGVVVVVLGLLVAALPQIKPLLPAEVARLLP